MKYITPPPGKGCSTIPGMARLELTRRNLETLLEKLDDPDSARTLIDPSYQIAVVAVENDEHYGDRDPGITYTNGEYK